MLAAGEGRRFGRPKALVEVDGERLVDRAARLVRDGGCSPVVVVSGAAPVEVAHASVVHNPHWAGGMGTSLAVGLAAMPDEATAVLIVLVDTPWLGAEAVRRVAEAHRRGATLAVATYDGERGHPVLLGRAHWAGVVELARGDIGARAYLARHPDVVTEVDCTGTGDPTDVDSPETLGGPDR